jgi:flagellar assembly protein FliH
MAVVRKYQFDRSFDPQPAAAPVPVELPVATVAMPEPEPEPSYSAAELEEVRKTALAMGREEGIRQAETMLAARQAAAADAIHRSLANLTADRQAIRRDAERRTAEILLTVLKKLTPILLERCGTMEIEALLDQVFRRMPDRDRLTVRCAADLVGSMDVLVREAASRAAYDGRLSVLADSRLAGDSCRVEWADGGVERHGQTIIETVEAELRDRMEAFDRRLGIVIPAEEVAA